MTKQTRVIAIYSRKSKFTGKGESIENQIELCRQYIASHNGTNAAETAIVFEDEGFSGGNLQRPQFKHMMVDAKAGKLSAVVVYRLDRISRNIGDFANLIEELSNLKIAFVSIREQFDTDSPMGRAMMYIASVFSQLERETIAERIRDNMHELAKTGRWLGGITPTGYASEQVKRVTVDGKVRKSCKLGLVPEEADTVKLIFSEFLKNNSLTKTDAVLLVQGCLTKNRKRFTRFAIKNILINPVYMTADEDAYDYLQKNNVELFSEKAAFDGEHGLMAYNRTLQKAGRANQIRPMSDWIVSVGNHPGLISGVQWVKVQQMLNQNKSKAYRKPRSNVALLSGLLICGDCGEFMRPKMTNRVTADSEQFYTYMCTLKERSKSQCCHIRNVNGNQLDKAIIEQVKQLSEDNGEFMQQLEKGRKSLKGNQEEYEQRLSQLQAEQHGNEEQIKALVLSLTKAAGTAAEEYIMQQIEELHEKNKLLTRHIEEVKQLVDRHNLSDHEFDLFRDMLSSFRNTIDGMTVEQQRAAIRTCVRKVIWDGENVHVYLFGSDGDIDDKSMTLLEEYSKMPDESIPLGENSK